MKQNFFISLLVICLVTTPIRADHNGHTKGGETSQTNLFIRQEFQSARPERVSLFRPWTDCSDSCMGSLEIVPMGGASTNASQLNRFFLFNNKSELVVGVGTESFGVNPFNNPAVRDVIATHFNIINQGGDEGIAPASFKSVIRFKPQRSFAGAGIQWHKNFTNWFCPDKSFWFEISTALMYVRHDMHLEETILSPNQTTNSLNGNSSMTEAFRGLKPFFLPTGDDAGEGRVTGQGWRFGKIDGKRTATNISDIELKFGIQWLCCEDRHLEGYIGLVAPAGKKPDAEFVFAPVTTQHHFGIMWGKSYGAELYSCADRSLSFEVEYNARYLFQDRQFRSFDLKNKPWSRYMLVYLSNADRIANNASEGINVFTQKFKVRPGLAVSLNAAFVATSCGMELEVGYNVWARQAEKIRLVNPWRPGPVLAQLDVMFYLPSVAISRADTIGEVFPEAGLLYNANTIIHESDLDFNSAANPAALSNTVYAALGYQFDCCRATFVGVGASYEFSGINTTLSRWMAWAKFGVSL